MSAQKKIREENWRCIFILFVMNCLVSLLLIIGLKALLDAEDEIKEHIIKGELRNRLYGFLYVFVLTFFFGCWGCCFCICYPCRIIANCPTFCGNLLTILAHLFVSRQPPRRFANDEDIEEIVITPHNTIPPLHPTSSDRYAYENPQMDMADVAFSEQSSTGQHIILPPKKTPLGRLRSYSIDVSFQ